MAQHLIWKSVYISFWDDERAFNLFHKLKSHTQFKSIKNKKGTMPQSPTTKRIYPSQTLDTQPSVLSLSLPLHHHPTSHTQHPIWLTFSDDNLESAFLCFACERQRGGTMVSSTRGGVGTGIWRESTENEIVGKEVQGMEWVTVQYMVWRGPPSSNTRLM